MGELLTVIGPVVGEALLAAITQVLTQLIAEKILNLTDTIAARLESVGGILGDVGGFLGDVVTEFGGNISGIINDGLFKVSDALSETLGLFGAQERLMADLQDRADKTTSALIDRLNLDGRDQGHRADDLVGGVVGQEATAAERLLNNGNALLGVTAQGASGWWAHLQERAVGTYEWVRDGLVGLIERKEGSVGTVVAGIRDKAFSAINSALDFASSIVAGFRTGIADLIVGLAAILDRLLTIDEGMILELATSFQGMLFDSMRKGQEQEDIYGGA